MSRPVFLVAISAAFGLFFVAGGSLSNQTRAHAQATVETFCPADQSNFGAFGPYQFYYCFDEVQTPNGKANVSFHGALTEESAVPSKTLHLSGFEYGTSDGPTTDCQLVITPSGEVNGTCKLH